jgi:hypothetical protein
MNWREKIVAKIPTWLLWFSTVVYVLTVLTEVEEPKALLSSILFLTGTTFLSLRSLPDDRKRLLLGLSLWLLAILLLFWRKPQSASGW